MIPANPLPLATAGCLLVLSFAGTAFGGKSFKSKNIRLRPCANQDFCLYEFRLRGNFRKPGEKHYFKFFNHDAFAELDLWVTARTKGTLPSGNGVKVIAYDAKKKGRRKKPTKLRELRKVARGLARLNGPRRDGDFNDAFLRKPRWVIICLSPKVRSETGDYNIYFEVEVNPPD